MLFVGNAIFGAVHLIDSSDALASIAPDLAEAPSLAIDLEAAGFHRYSDRVCLIQVSTPADTYILDPLAVDVSSALRPALESREVPVLMHGGDYDLRMLDRDLGLHPVSLFDTQVAASFLAEPGLGLAALLEKYFGVKLSKKYQRADWAKRPLTRGMLDYAAADTDHLHELAAILARKLQEVGRDHWAQEEFEIMESIRWEEEPEDADPVTRVKTARDLSPGELERLRAALAWRDGVARERDRALFRVVGDSVLVDVARSEPRSVEDLLGLKGFSESLARRSGEDLLARLEEARQIPADQCRGYPRPPRRGPARTTPEEEERIARLKAVRNRRAEDVGLPRGTLLPNGTLEALGRAAPKTREGLRSVPGMRMWQVEVLGDDLLEAMSP